MLQGKINAALTLLPSETTGGVLPLSDTVIQSLIEKHPAPAQIQEEALLFGPVDNVASNYFDSIDESSIAKAAQTTKGAAGPSHVDAKQYRHILLSNKYKAENKLLREEISSQESCHQHPRPSNIRSVCQLPPRSAGQMPRH